MSVVEKIAYVSRQDQCDRSKNDQESLRQRYLANLFILQYKKKAFSVVSDVTILLECEHSQKVNFLRHVHAQSQRSCEVAKGGVYITGPVCRRDWMSTCLEFPGLFIFSFLVPRSMFQAIMLPSSPQVYFELHIGGLLVLHYETQQCFENTL